MQYPFAARCGNKYQSARIVVTVSYTDNRILSYDQGGTVLCIIFVAAAGKQNVFRKFSAAFPLLFPIIGIIIEALVEQMTAGISCKFSEISVYHIRIIELRRDAV